jgi:hypothetical protein
MSGNADMVGAIVNAGKTAWDIVKDGAAKSGAASSFCSAVPDNLKFTELSGWKTKTGTWRYLLENLYGANVVDVQMKYSFDYNGQSDKAPGALFVTNFTVYSTKASVLWGYECNISATVKGSPTNVGSKTRVIGAVPLLVTASYGSMLRVVSNTMMLQARGDGRLVQS